MGGWMDCIDDDDDDDDVLLRWMDLMGGCTGQLNGIEWVWAFLED
jgi:hypothetical protein